MTRYLTEQFEAGTPIREIIFKRAWLIDQLLVNAWHHHIDSDAMALIAVGGYGRGEFIAGFRRGPDAAHQTAQPKIPEIQN